MYFPDVNKFYAMAGRRNAVPAVAVGAASPKREDRMVVTGAVLAGITAFLAGSEWATGIGSAAQRGRGSLAGYGSTSRLSAEPFR
jgi:hypothetical protein